ncbi:MAG TPA: hypothetical protein VNB06_10840 [Thermoanaerobaculia bacterium]|nr:hypothetical protein [Thermoanaerobaculia bacterium]
MSLRSERPLPSLRLVAGGVLAMGALVGASSAQVVPGHPDVIGEYLEVPGARATETPEALNRVAFLRLRHRTPSLPDEADAVVIAQPGFASTPGAWLQLGSQLVAKAHDELCPIPGATDRRCSVEVWIIDRRGSNLEDTEGLRRAWSARDPRRAVEYYYGLGVFTERGTIRRPARDDYDSLLGGPGARFRPLTQRDLAFVWDWGFETAAGDIDALLELLPRRSRGSSVFVAGHSQGGGFVSAWAGRRAGGRRGHEQIAGLVFLDGGPSIGESAEPAEDAINEHLREVSAIRGGARPRFGAELAGIPIGSGLGVRSAVLGLYYVLQPDEEALFPPSVRPAHSAAECFVFGYHAPEGECGGVGLRLTNRAHAGMAFDDDPVPGAFLQTPIITALGVRSGRLDFQPRPGTAGDCAAAGPHGLQPPCPPSQRQIQPERLYRWLDGGGGGPAGDDGPLNGWTSFDGGATFVERHLQPGPNPTRVEAYIQQVGYTPTVTNIKPLALRFDESGERTIDARVLNGMTWYQSRRYDVDIGFLGGFQVVRLNRDGVRYDVDKTTIAVPVYVAARETRANPFPRVEDYTAIGPQGTAQSESARRVSPFDAGLASRLYGHSDFLTADDSMAGSVRPGEPGSSLVANTLLPWLLARSSATVKVPSSERLGVESWR